MAVLSKSQIKNLHVMMMGFGKKLVKGYNKFDWNYTAPMMDKKADDFTTAQCFTLCKTLCKYKNTQLKEFKSDLEDTLNYYCDLTWQTKLNY